MKKKKRKRKGGKKKKILKQGEKEKKIIEEDKTLKRTKKKYIITVYIFIQYNNDFSKSNFSLVKTGRNSCTVNKSRFCL